MKNSNDDIYIILLCKYCLYFSQACTIQLDEEVLVTGGYDNPTRVDVYTIDGWSRELPQLNNGRNQHGCGQYINTDDKMVNCTTGG